MRELIVAAILITLSSISEQQSTCYCANNLVDLDCALNSNYTCILNDGECYAEFTLGGDNTVSEMYGCYSLDQIRRVDFCNTNYNSSNKVFLCCNDEDECNRRFITENPFTTPPPMFTVTEDGNTSAVQIAVPISVVFLLIVTIVTVIITVILIRCRKKRMERGRRGDPVDNELSCDMQVAFPLDEYTDPSGSGFGMPHLEQRTVARSIKLRELIGTGRYGQVLLGDYQGERVAVKKFLSIDGQSWQRETEIYTTTLLTHDSILRFIGCDMISNNGATELWLITQYHQHGSLFDYLNKNEVSDKVLMLMMTSICSGLSHLHTELFGTIKKAAIAHRDIKTKNILVKNDLRCCIADFGLAVIKGNADKLNLPKNPKQGTKRYMAPEILNESININYFESFQHTDIYALGLVFWEMCRRLNGPPGVPALDYEPPFYGLVPPDPSFDEMKRIVVIEKQQPSIPARWFQEQLLKNLLQLMRECWSYKSDARPSAVYLKKKLNKLCKEDKLEYDKTIE